MALFQIGPGVVATLVYEVFDGEGELIGGSNGEREILFGCGELLPAVEHALEGLAPGARKTVRVAAKDAFGERDPKALVEFDREEFPADVAAGDVFEAEGEGGETVVLRVLEVFEDAVVVDRNHPLAGQSLRVEVEVRATRPATAEELEAAERAAEAEPGTADSALIPADRLLRGPPRG